MLWYLLALVLPLAAILTTISGASSIFLSVVLLGVPAADWLIGRESSYAKPDKSKSFERVVFYLPHIFLSLWLIAIWSAGHRLQTAGIPESICIYLSAGLMAALATPFGHEFMHRGECQHSLRASRITFSMLAYGHYTISHPMHHAKPGNPTFGSSPALGTSLWRHLFPSIKSGFTAAWRNQLRKGGLHPARNAIMGNWCTTIVTGSLMTYLWGARGFLLFIVQAVVAIFFIETIGYVQHYGLSQVGGSAKVDLALDGDFWLSNRLLINNPLHAMHHRSPTLVFTELSPVATVLPAGYFTIIWAAMIPSIWRRLMDDRVSDVSSEVR